jgi:hypothetical protein
MRLGEEALDLVDVEASDLAAPTVIRHRRSSLARTRNPDGAARARVADGRIRRPWTVVVLGR